MGLYLEPMAVKELIIHTHSTLDKHRKKLRGLLQSDIDEINDNVTNY
jgi:hypothetical protein